MKAKVLRRFRDKYNGKLYKAGDTITVSKERFDEILSVGELVARIDSAKKSKSTAD